MPLRNSLGNFLYFLPYTVSDNFVVRVSGMSTVRVNVWVRVRVSNLLGSD